MDVGIMLKNSYRVVHFSRSPLVGAPSKLSQTLCMNGIESLAFCLEDYPEKGGLYQKFSHGSIVLKNADKVIMDLTDRAIRSADILHIHNDIPSEFLAKVLDLGIGAKFVYQVHSPLREGPLYIDRSQYMGIQFDAYLVVGQYQPRHFPKFRPVPNLILEFPFCRLRERGEKLRVLFSPLHNRGGRWNAKFSPMLEDVLNVLGKSQKIEAITPRMPVSPYSLFQLRKTCHLTIDEIITGAYHQVSLEGLFAGNVVLNCADYFSRSCLSSMVNAGELPPFVYTDESNVLDILMEFSLDVEGTKKFQKYSFDFATEYLNANRLVKIFRDVYEKII